MQHGFAAHPQGGKIKQIGQALLYGVYFHPWNAGQPFQPVIPQRLCLGIGLLPGRQGLNRRAKAGDEGRGLGARAQAALLAPPKALGRILGFAQVQGADPLGPWILCPLTVIRSTPSFSG